MTGTQLYIPEIGDLLELVHPWHFTLHSEYRNRDVWDALDGDNHPSLADWKRQQAAIRAEISQIEERMVEVQREEPRGFPIFTASQKDFASVADRDRHRILRATQQWEGDRTIPATLPEKTRLRVDRIYIRKGKGEYSSITFFIERTTEPRLSPAKKGGGFKKGRRRFWAKLADVNTMVVQRVATVDDVLASNLAEQPTGRKVRLEDEE